MKSEITINGVLFEVEFDYQPYEPPDMGYDSTGYPGCEPSIENIALYHKGTDFTDFFEDDMDYVEELIWAAMAIEYEPY